MARKLTPEELERFKADFDPPAWAADEQATRKDSSKNEEIQEATPETKKDLPKIGEVEKETKPKRKGRGNPNGRPPSEKPRLNNLHVRLSDEDAEMLEEAARLTGKKKTAVIVEGVRRVYEEAAAKAWTKARAGFKEFEKETRE